MSKVRIQATAIPFGNACPVEAKPQSWTGALLGAVLLAACGHLIIKFGLNQKIGLNQVHGAGSGSLAQVLNPWLILGLAVYGLGTVLWIFAVSRKQISYLYPITALNYAVVAMGGQMLFRESVSARRWLGILVVIAGVGIMQWSTKPEAA